ncbi:ArsR/SmtB family transcription factor [Aquirufa beregesia]
MQVESIAKALGDESRRKIVELLKDGELPASTIFEQFNYAAPTISRHLSVLKEAGLVSTRRNGVFIYYSLEKEALQVIQNWLAPLLGTAPEKPKSVPRERSQKPKIKTESNPFEKFQSEF